MLFSNRGCSLVVSCICNTVFALCAVVATALAQIFTNTYQKSLDCNAMQLLYHTSPYITLVSSKHFDISFVNV